jgi:peptidoglycan/LPS O-acetylase OafA/YrhL
VRSTHLRQGEATGTRVAALDGVRGFAILLVLCAHLTPFRASASLFGRIINGIAGVGWCGVSLFFVLSGFLITGILVDSKEDRHCLRNFYARRTLRIFPLYYALVLFCTLVAPLLKGFASAQPASDAWMYWLYLSNYHDAFRGSTSDGWLGPLWSLAVEEHFYLVWPTVILLCSRANAIRVCFSCFVIATLCRLWFATHGNLTAPYLFTPCRFDDLAAGSLAALLLRSDKLRPKLPLLAMAGMWITAVPAMLLTIWKHGVIFNPVVELLGLPLFGQMFSCLILLLVLPDSAPHLKRAFESRSLRVLGRYRYGLYIFHPAIIALAGHPFSGATQSPRINDLLNAGLLAGLSFLAALLSWHLYEEQFLSLRSHFAKESEVADIRTNATPESTCTAQTSALSVPC